jgi:serine/threonine protein kinase
MAKVIRLGEPPPTYGGDCEREVAALLEKKLPEVFLLICNPSLPTANSFFYEYDLIVVHPYFCDVVEVKQLMGTAIVSEHLIMTDEGFTFDGIFSTLENKTKVLSSKLRHAPFGHSNGDRVNSRVVLGSKCSKIAYRYKPHEDNAKVLRIGDLVAFYKKRDKEEAGSYSTFQSELRRDKVLKAWREFQESVTPGSRTRDTLGRFLIKRRLVAGPPREYLAMDEPPCKVDVHLKEFPYLPTATRKELEDYLDKVSREMQALRRIRHPNICCVVGHFRTGHSLVQVSDYFDGSPLSECWHTLRELQLPEKLGLIAKVARGLGYCHGQGVFHRNLDASQVLVDEAWKDVRVQGFEFAKDLDATHTITEENLSRRDPRLTPPEDLVGGGSDDPRRSDVFQLGILLYRVVEDGIWPFENTMDYFTGGGHFREMTNHSDDLGVGCVRELIVRMLSIRPADRPDPIAAVEAKIGTFLDRMS